jgi:hypothetical protein
VELGVVGLGSRFSDLQLGEEGGDDGGPFLGVGQVLLARNKRSLLQPKVRSALGQHDLGRCHEGKIILIFLNKTKKSNCFKQFFTIKMVCLLYICVGTIRGVFSGIKTTLKL